MASKIDKLMKIRARIFSQPEVFRISYTPRDILERKETEQLYRELSSFVSYKNPNHILLVGDPGTGKTVTMNFIASKMPEIENTINVLSVNCNGKNTEEILSFLIEKNSSTPKKIDTLLEIFLMSLSRDTLLILDEVDKGYRIYALLYALSRPKEVVNTCKHNVNLVLISNNHHWEEQLSPYLRSSLQLRKLLFAPYAANQLKSILLERIKFGFIKPDTIPEDLLRQIVQKTDHDRGGDCRVALKTVFLAGKHAEEHDRDNINQDDVDAAYMEAVQEVESQRLISLSHNQFIALLASYEKAQSIEQLYESYVTVGARISFDNWKPIGLTSFYHILEYIESQGLIKKDVRVDNTVSPPVRRTHVTVNVDKKIVEAEIAKRLAKQ